MGADKYGSINWFTVPPEEYIAAAMRHINALRRGEVYDKESGLHHFAHACADLSFAMEMDLVEAKLCEEDEGSGPDTELE